MKFPRQHKYGVAPLWERTDADGNVYASKAEMLRWFELLKLLAAHQIFNLKRQVRFDLHAGEPPVVVTWYVADSTYEDSAGNRTVEDVKGVSTREFKIKQRMMAAEYGIEIQLVTARSRGR
jgi:Protein of unknown function (DUF1064)